MSDVAPHIDQYSATIPLGKVTKVAGYAGPFQVINASTTNTIWLGDNPAVSSSHGIPLYPGTGMVWVGSQGTKELYAVQDITSTVASDVIIGDAVRDWQPNPVAIATAVLNSGVLLVDNPVSLMNVSAINSNRTLGPFNVSTYQSIFVNYTVSGTAHTVQLDLVWSTAGGFNQDTFKWIAGDISSLSGKQLPARGTALTVNITLVGGAPSDGCQVIASNRPWSPLNQNMMGGGAGSSGRVIASGANGALAAAAAFTVTPEFRYDGPVIVCATMVPGGQALECLDTFNNRLFGGRPDAGIVGAGANRSYITEHTVAPRNSSSYRTFNLSGGVAAATIEVIAAPEGT